eukprot:m.232273 g.232273  ORF g.232273 m.232273 type:complete len:85 (+) comp10875_c0_seq54:1235-1489(+)
MERRFLAEHQYWSHRTPLAFGLGAARAIITTLLCAKVKPAFEASGRLLTALCWQRRGLHLPVELWQHVFSHLQRRDFARSSRAQ